MSETRELLDLACRLAVDGGKLAAAGWHRDVAAGRTRQAMTAATKSSRTDVVTLHDRAAEGLLVSTLAARRPADAIVGEEGTQRPGTSGISWYVDPIDGTTNFLYGLPLWSTSVGATDASGSLVGAVYVPATDELFAAARGHGATRNGRTIRASGEVDLTLALVATGFSYQPARRAVQASRIAAIVPHIRDIRRTGSAAIDLCYTAAGIVDAYFEDGLNSWDIVAGELIARESGCRSGDFASGPSSPAELLVSSPGLFDALSALLATTRDPPGEPRRVPSDLPD